MDQPGEDLKWQCIQFYICLEMEKDAKPTKPTYEAVLAGPILITAAHSAALMRGGPTYKEKERKHLRQWYTSVIATRTANNLKQLMKESGSLCVWRSTHKLADNDLDPNYLLESNKHLSPFHRMLHCFASQHRGRPIMHLDIHGKMDRADNCQIEIGTEPMNQLWEQFQFRQQLSRMLKQGFDKIFQGLSFKGFKQKANVEPNLHGFWGGGIMTMTDQAIRMGIPSFQLQIPLQVRRLMFSQRKYCQGFSLIVYEIYMFLVVPWFKKERFILGEQELGRHIFLRKDLEGLEEELEAWEEQNIIKNKKGI